MMKKILYVSLILILILTSCSKPTSKNEKEEKQRVNSVLDNWHKAAAEANYENYFGAMDSVSVFIGTDASENWTKKEFESFSKPYFDKGKTWVFTAFNRNIYFNEQTDIAWFDELLHTWMGTCRGSGVLEYKNGTWNINHYVLSIAIPNDDIQKVIEAKKENDSVFVKSFTPTSIDWK